MTTTELSRSAMELTAEERLRLARELIESVAAPAALSEAVREGVRRLEDIATGKVAALDEEQFRAALL
ncbi:Putative addiction module component [Opitutaceae bacterium TAV1]|nr:Putative addiction module component [Opitutaceae bacterium TAV1]